MENRVVVTELDVPRDERGFVFEPVGSGDIAGFENVHVVSTKPGAVRGNHYHRKKSETLAVVGPATVRVEESGAVTDFEVPDGSVHRFDIPVGVAHAVRFGGNLPGLLVSFGDRAFSEADPDVVRVNLFD